MSSIPSSAMPHAKAHDDEDQPRDHLAPTDEGTLAEVKEKAADVQEKVTDEAARLTGRATTEAREHPKTGIALGAIVAVGVAALAALPFLLPRSDDEKRKSRKAKPKAPKHKPKD